MSTPTSNNRHFSISTIYKISIPDFQKEQEKKDILILWTALAKQFHVALPDPNTKDMQQEFESWCTQMQGQLFVLTELDLHEQKITSFPLGFFERIPHLQTLDISFTSIQKFPEICSLKYLIRLDLHNTDISEFPKEIGNLQTLEELNFNKTKIYVIPDSFKNLTNLKSIGFDPSICQLKNQEKNFPPQFQKKGKR